MKKTLFVLVLALALALTLAATASAQSFLVPCGNPGQPACTPCHLITLANNTINFLFKMIILPLAALGVLASGITLLTSGGSETQSKKGKDMLRAIIIGFFVAITAWALLNTLLGNLVKPGYNYLTQDFPACVTGQNE